MPQVIPRKVGTAGGGPQPYVLFDGASTTFQGGDDVPYVQLPGGAIVVLAIENATGAFSGLPEVSIDGQTWWNLTGKALADQSAVSTITSVGAFVFDCQGWFFFRFRPTVNVGLLTVHANLAEQVGSVTGGTGAGSAVAGSAASLVGITTIVGGVTVRGAVSVTGGVSLAGVPNVSVASQVNVSVANTVGVSFAVALASAPTIGVVSLSGGFITVAGGAVSVAGLGTASLAGVSVTGGVSVSGIPTVSVASMVNASIANTVGVSFAVALASAPTIGVVSLSGGYLTVVGGVVSVAGLGTTSLAGVSVTGGVSLSGVPNVSVANLVNVSVANTVGVSFSAVLSSAPTIGVVSLSGGYLTVTGGVVSVAGLGATSLAGVSVTGGVSVSGTPNVSVANLVNVSVANTVGVSFAVALASAPTIGVISLSGGYLTVSGGVVSVAGGAVSVAGLVNVSVANTVGVSFAVALSSAPTIGVISLSGGYVSVSGGAVSISGGAMSIAGQSTVSSPLGPVLMVAANPALSLAGSYAAGTGFLTITAAPLTIGQNVITFENPAGSGRNVYLKSIQAQIGLLSVNVLTANYYQISKITGTLATKGGTTVANLIPLKSSYPSAVAVIHTAFLSTAGGLSTLAGVSAIGNYFGAIYQPGSSIAAGAPANPFLTYQSAPDGLDDLILLAGEGIAIVIPVLGVNADPVLVSANFRWREGTG